MNIMKIIISETFQKKFLNKLNKYFTIKDLINELSKEKFNIVLKRPFYKLKFKINLVEFRWVVLIIQNEKIIPLILYLKKDKKNWENIRWNEYENMILEMQYQTSKDLENWNFKIF